MAKGKKKRKIPLRAKLSKRPKHDAKRSRDQPPQDNYKHRHDEKGTGQHQGDARSETHWGRVSVAAEWMPHTLPFPQFEIAAAACPGHSACRVDVRVWLVVP